MNPLHRLNRRISIAALSDIQRLTDADSVYRAVELCWLR
jgi:hypothetical protein